MKEFRRVDPPDSYWESPKEEDNEYADYVCDLYRDRLLDKETEKSD